MKLFLFFIFSNTLALANVEINEANLMTFVNTKNNHVLGSKEQARAAEKLTGHLTRSYLPKAEVKIGSENFKTGNSTQMTQPFGSIEANLNVFNSGNDKLEEDLRQEQSHNAKNKFNLIQREELKKARKTFWNLVSLVEMKSLLENAVKENDQNLSSANARIKAGAAVDTDRLEFEMYRIELEQDLART